MTQGLVTITRGGKVVMKIIAGCDGDRAEMLADELRELGRIPHLTEAYTLARLCSFGSDDCLVIMTETKIVFKGDEDLDPRYRETFDQPEFNPRWTQGTADFVEVVEL